MMVRPQRLLARAENWLLRNHPNLWSLRLPYLAVGVALACSTALFAGFVTPIRLDRMPPVRLTYPLWHLLGALPIIFWAIRFLHVRMPVIHGHTTKRIIGILGPLAACIAALAPVKIYLVIIEDRMQAVVEPVQAELLIYSCLVDEVRTISEMKHEEDTSHWKGVGMCMGQDLPAPPAADADVQKSILECRVDPKCRLWLGPPCGLVDVVNDHIRKITAVYDVEMDSVGQFNTGTGDDSMQMAIMVAKIAAFGDDSDLIDHNVELWYFPYRQPWRTCIALFFVFCLSHLLHFARQSNLQTFAYAILTASVMLSSVLLISTLDDGLTLIAPAVQISLFLVGTAVVIAPQHWAHHEFIVDLWLCTLPLAGFSIAILANHDDLPAWQSPEFMLPGLIGSVALLIASPVVHIVVERFRSFPR